MPSLAAIARAQRAPCSSTTAPGLRAVTVLFALLTCSAQLKAAAPALPADHAQRMTRGLEVFQSDVRALLSEHCLKCHGGEKIKGGLDLSTREGLIHGGEEGPAVVLYDAPNSRLYQLITHAKEPHMPSKGEKLPPAAIEKIASWIQNGAPYDKPLIEGKSVVKADRSLVNEKDRQWWAFLPLKQSNPPSVAKKARVKNPVDNFILSKLEEKKLGLSPAADRRTLIRRASFALQGLPPTPEQVKDFQNDSSPQAWQKVIQQLLESPRYGERWARHWLDIARFAESSGFEHDYDRPSAYHYRDFLIRALNSDLPFDQFVRWQLAGDEFEPDNPLALMATGFLGAGVFPTQITANEVERTRYDALDDMLSTTTTAMLGLTVGCARCHDHKFDPIPTKDYYRMLATFSTTVRSDLDLDLEPEENRRKQERFDQNHAPLVAQLKAYEEADLARKFEAWISAGAPWKTNVEWDVLEPTLLHSKAGTTFKRLDDGSYLAEGKNGESDVYTFNAVSKASGLRSLRVEALSHSSLPKGGPGRAENGNIGLSRIRVFASPLKGGTTNEIRLIHPRSTFEQNNSHLSIASALDDNPRSGWAVDPRFGTNHAAVFAFEPPLDFDGGTRIDVRLEFDLNKKHNIGRLRVSTSMDSSPALDGDSLPSLIAESLRKLQSRPQTASPLPTEERASLLAWWKPSDPGWKTLQDKVSLHAKEAPKKKTTKVLVCAEGYPAVRMHTQGADFFPETHFLQRGSTDLKIGVAPPGFLQVLQRDFKAENHWQWQPPTGARFSGRRRVLASWMTDAEHGAGHLLARVIVNRLWQHHFGQGLVATPNDFGVQGAKPSHPELLDWLASQLIQNGWRIKPMHALILSSATYQQGSKTDPAALKLDPGNTLVSHRSPQRLQAEAIRDSLLFVSGTLDTNMFGPGTLDEASRRRSIYFTVKRSQLIPAMQVFDAPEPLVSQGTRPTTTVAPQALLLMNSRHVRSWAESFAKRCSTDQGISLTTSITKAYSLALSRAPSKDERTEALRFIERQTTRYRAEGKTDAPQRALIDLAQVVLSLNELIYVE